MKNDYETTNTEQKSEHQSSTTAQDVQTEVSEKIVTPKTENSQYWKDMNEFLVNLA